MVECGTQAPCLAGRQALTIQRQMTLVDLLDRVLGKGVVAYGDIVLSIADLDLVYLNLRAVLSSIGTLEKGQGSFPPEVKNEKLSSPNALIGDQLDSRLRGNDNNQMARLPDGQASFGGRGDDRGESGNGMNGKETASEKPDPMFTSSQPTFDEPTFEPLGRLELDPKKVEQGLAKLVLTLINLLRKLMERQAIRRMEAGTLTPQQLEKAGQAFQRLDERLRNLRDQFGLKEEDLNMDLGPLGELV